MTKIIDAIQMCNEKISTYQKENEKIKNIIGRSPKFIIINASNDEGNERYIKGKIKEGEKSGLQVQVVKFD